MNLCFFRTPWFPEGESDRLLIAPVKDRDALKACFDLILIPDIALGMEFPPQLTWRQFEDKYFRSPRKDVFLLMDKASRKLAGFVILWPVQGKKNWHQISLWNQTGIPRPRPGPGRMPADPDAHGQASNLRRRHRHREYL